MANDLDFGHLRSSEADKVEERLGNSVICSTCGTTLNDYADKCSAPLDEPCLGFLLIEGARLHIRRRAA